LRGSGLSDSESVSACLLCYNDAETIAGLVERAAGALDELGLDGEIVVVDDGSSDDSLGRLREVAELEPRLRIVEHVSNRGYGGALRSALGAAAGDWVFYTDGDGQYDPAQLARLARHAGPDVDWIQGYKRYRSDPLNRRVVGAVYAASMGFLFGLPIRDIDCDFRLMRAELLRELRLEKDSGAICVELVRGLNEAGARHVEVEVDHFERPHGRSQFFRPRRVLFSLYDVATLWVRLVARPAVGRLIARATRSAAQPEVSAGRARRESSVLPPATRSSSAIWTRRTATDTESASSNGIARLSAPANPASRTPSPPGTKNAASETRNPTENDATAAGSTDASTG
jgi:glycosyltransferase involved in cell wall biosynthesis